MSFILIDYREDGGIYVDGDVSFASIPEARAHAARTARGIEGYVYMGESRSASVSHTPAGWAVYAMEWGLESTPPPRRMVPYLVAAQQIARAWVVDEDPIVPVVVKRKRRATSESK